MNQNDLIRLVSELEIADDMKSELLDSIQNGQTQSAVQMLRKYRSAVLGRLHNGQDLLYQIDFVLQKAEQEETL